MLYLKKAAMPPSTTQCLLRKQNLFLTYDAILGKGKLQAQGPNLTHCYNSPFNKEINAVNFKDTYCCIFAFVYFILTLKNILYISLGMLLLCPVFGVWVNKTIH